MFKIGPQCQFQNPFCKFILQTKTMALQYTYDANGKPVGVFIPISEWEEITADNEQKIILTKTKKAALLKSISKGLLEVEQIKKGTKKAIPIQQLLDEL